MDKNKLRPECGDVLLFVGDGHMYLVEADGSVVCLRKEETNFNLPETYDKFVTLDGFSVYRDNKKIYSDKKCIENLKIDRERTLKKLENIEKELNYDV